MFTNSLLLFQLDDFVRRLLRWSEVLIREYPKCNHTISNASELNLGKLVTGGVITTDTFNEAQNKMRLLVEEVKKISE